MNSRRFIRAGRRDSIARWRRCLRGIDQFARAAEWDFLEISGLARLASGIEGMPCRLFHFAAFVVRQAS